MIDPTLSDDGFLEETRAELQRRMTEQGAHIRDPRRIRQAVSDAWALYARMREGTRISSARMWPAAFRNLDLCLTHAVYLEAVAEYLERGGRSRGSYLVLTPEGEKPVAELSDDWRFALNAKDAFVEQKVLEIWLDADSKVRKEWIDVRPIPDEDTWFENVWNKFMKDEIVR